MKSNKAYAIGLIVAALVMSHIMCAHIAYVYCEMRWGIEYAGYSAPAGVAFILLIPYVIGIIVALVAASVFWKKAQNE